jgi:hypothetical protein
MDPVEVAATNWSKVAETMATDKSAAVAQIGMYIALAPCPSVGVVVSVGADGVGVIGCATCDSCSEMGA